MDDDGLSFDVYVEITDPPWQVEHQASDYRVSVAIGGPPEETPPINLLWLWFKDPDTVLTLGSELTTAGMKLAAQLRTPLPDSDEEYPVPGTKADTLEPSEEL